MEYQVKYIPTDSKTSKITFRPLSKSILVKVSVFTSAQEKNNHSTLVDHFIKNIDPEWKFSLRGKIKMSENSLIVNMKTKGCKEGSDKLVCSVSVPLYNK